MRLLLRAIVTGCCLTAVVAAQVDVGTEEQRQAGKALYDKFCSQCHGETGDGLGVAAPYVKPKPRDFRPGKFKVRTTPTGSLPTTDDLKNIIRLGMPYSTMPAWPEFSEQQLTQLAYYVKSFYPGFAEADENVDPIEIASPPAYSAESAAKGRQVYENLGCAKCHGDQGRGDGLSAPTLADDWGFHIRPANLTRPWTYRGGSERRDIYRTIVTGFNGTPMPSYADEGALAKEDRWPLVDYIYSLSETREPEYSSIVSAFPVTDEIDLERGAEQFQIADRARFAVIGQVIEPGRNFYPATTDVEVRAIYNRKDIAVLVEWDDMSAQTTGGNSPQWKAPLFDPVAEMEAEKRAKVDESGDGSDDPFADPFAEEAPEPASAEEPVEEAPSFADAVAVQFPVKLPEGNRKPYFLMGDGANPVDLWFMDLSGQSPKLYTSRGSDAIEETQGEAVEGSASYSNGRWSVILKRKRNSSRGVSFREMTFVPIAFSVWDGFHRDQGNRRGITAWAYLHVEPIERPSVIGPMLQNAVLVFLGLVVVVFLVRRSAASRTA